MLQLRLFSHLDGVLVSHWVTSPEYEVFFRNNAILPTREECANYPNWSQNIVIMIDNVEGNQGTTIGMAIAYHVNYRNRSAKAGLLLDKEFQKKGHGHNAQFLWLNFLFNRLGFRKVIVENVDEYLTKPYLEAGFFIEGRHLKESLVNGEYVDEIRMACFNDEWKGASK